uniref:Uncharacterized protein n=1 Tax=Aplanochytrium stocchinoi TaxID=215587 RepID=A0A7S3PEJ4_9STRA
MNSILHSTPTSRVRAVQLVSIVLNLFVTIYAVLYSAGIGMYESKKAWQITVLHWLASPVIAMWEYSPSTSFEFALPAAWILLSFNLRGGMINEWSLGVTFYQIIIGLSYKKVSKKRTCEFLIRINMLIIVGFWIMRVIAGLNLSKPSHKMDAHLRQGFVHLITDSTARFYVGNELILHGVIQGLLILSQLCMLEIWRRDRESKSKDSSIKNKEKPKLNVEEILEGEKGFMTRSTRDVLYFFIGWVGCSQVFSPDLMPYPFIPPNPCRAAAAVMATVMYIY